MMSTLEDVVVDVDEEQKTQRNPQKTEELEDEWPEDLEDEQEQHEFDEEGHQSVDRSYGAQSVSFTTPLNTHIHTNSHYDGGTADRPVGTFLVREEVPQISLLPKTPGGKKRVAMNNMFTPSALERLFEPPSPEPLPAEPIPEEQPDDILETDIPNIHSFHGKKFTFQMPKPSSTPAPPTPLLPRPAPSSLKGTASKRRYDQHHAQAQSTPHHTATSMAFKSLLQPPSTDPRLRLFQFQYDTYTRDHLSALVDSIGINASSEKGTGTTTTPTSNRNLGSLMYGSYSHSRTGSSVSRSRSIAPSSVERIADVRSAKRIKLSLDSDESTSDVGGHTDEDEEEEQDARISRPKLYGKDYVGEAQALMARIKSTKEYSTISTVPNSETPSVSRTKPASGFSAQQKQKQKQQSLTVPDAPRQPSTSSIACTPSTSTNDSPGGAGGSLYSSSSYRQKAAALMEQIKSDVKKQKRVFNESDTSHLTHVDSVSSTPKSFRSTAKANANLGTMDKDSSVRKSQRQPQPKRKDAEDLAQEFSRVSLRDRNALPTPVVNVLHTPSASASSSTTVAQQRPQPPAQTHLAPQYPSIRAHNPQEDLARFVSSSTTASNGTTLRSTSTNATVTTNGGAPSFVKHPGPAHLRTIAPTDLPSMPEQVGDMIYDRVRMRWVKTPTTARTGINMGNGTPRGETSDDPFGDIESLRDENHQTPLSTRSHAGAPRASPVVTPVETEEEDEGEGEGEGEGEESIAHEMSRISEHPEDEEEVELMSFSTDASHQQQHQHQLVDADAYDRTTDSDDSAQDDLDTARQQQHQQTPAVSHEGFDSDFEDASRGDILPVPTVQLHEPPQQSQPQPQQQQQTLPVAATPSRGNSPVMLGTPVIKSALKSRSVTPTSALKSRNQRYDLGGTPSQQYRRSVSFSDGKREGPIEGISASGGPVSIRSKRIAEMMNALEDSDLEDGDSPSKASSSAIGLRPEELQPLSARPSVGEHKAASGANGSSVATHRTSLSKVITDVQPFEPHWEELASIDLSDAKLESVARLKEFLPKLEALSLNRNQIAWLSGIPGSVRTLSVASNCLTGLTSYNHLRNLESLDISGNEVDSLRQLECLRHLRELKADKNKISNIEGLERLGGLVKLSLQGNSLSAVDLGNCRWARLEMLNMSENRLTRIEGLETLQSLIALNLDHNALTKLDARGPLTRLRILRASFNQLTGIEVGRFPNVRTLYADNNAIPTLGRLERLENLSLRNQKTRIRLPTRNIRDVKRLYLSGNALGGDLFDEACYHLVYLELAGCRLTALPAGLGTCAPNLRVLNLNYNFLSDIGALGGLGRLQKLSVVGSRLESTRALIRLVGRLAELEVVDFRMNPCTLGWYLPVLGTEGEGEWRARDGAFRRGLPDSGYVGRLAYRGLLMGRAARLKMVDGVAVSGSERTKALGLLSRLGLDVTRLI